MNQENGESNIPLAPLPCGPVVIGAIDHVNGPASAKDTIQISRHEAKVIVEHYLREIDTIHYFWIVLGQTGSYEICAEPHAWMRFHADQV
jgi:hypothetical protein